MTFFSRLKLSAAALALMIASPAVAQVQSTPLPELSPAVIAADVTTVYIDGEARRSAPTFDPFEADATLGGRANLREARGEVDRVTGEPIYGDGAILDLAMLYTASRDEFDLRGFTDAVFLSGEQVRSVRYNPITRECSSQVTETIYRDDYYAGVSHGLLFGLYSAFPRYRGHRNYDFYLDGYRRPNWRRPRAYRSGYARGYRGGYRDGYGHSGYRDRGYRRHIGSGPGRRADRRRDRRADDRYRDRDRRADLRDDRRGDRRADRGADRRNDRRNDTRTPARTRDAQTGNQPRNMRVGTGIGRLDNRRMTNARPVSPRIATDRTPTTRATTRRGNDRRTNRSGERRDAQRRNARDANAAARRMNERRANERRADARRAARTPEPRRARSERNEPAIPRMTAPRSVARTLTPTRRAPQRLQSREAPRVQRRMENAPRAAAPAPRSAPRPAPVKRAEPKRSAPKRSAPKRSQRTNRQTNRKTDRAFRGNSRGNKRGLEYYPVGTYQASTVVDTRCAKEEQLALFIPAERLDAARFDGLTILVLDGQGQEIPVFIPPNYIEGFQQGLRPLPSGVIE